MLTIRQPPTIVFGEKAVRDYSFPNSSLIITSKGAKKRSWINYLNISNSYIFDQVEPNPSIETAEKILNEFRNSNLLYVIGIGGGSSLDVAKYLAYKLNKRKILIPTTFGSGSEVTRISVLKVNGKKRSFHNDGLIADVAIIDPFFIKNTPFQIIKKSAIDACAQCTEAFDSKESNIYTKFLCNAAFDILEAAIMNENYEKLPLGSLIAGLGFGNSSTTLGHALSYVFSNEGLSHGHALAYTTVVAHRFNNSCFYDRFLKIVKKLNFTNIKLKQDIEEASELILADKKHLDNNPKKVTKNDLVFLLDVINNGKAHNSF